MTTPLQPNVFARECPSREVLAQIANKWSLLVIDGIGDGCVRNNELLRRIDGISQKMLTATLRDLEALRVVAREDHRTVPPHVEYRLTELGRSLRAAVCELDRWVEQNLRAMRPELRAA